LDCLVVDVIVAEAAEVEVRKCWIVRAVGDAARGPRPDRSIGDWEWYAVPERPLQLRGGGALRLLARVEDRPGDPLLVLGGADRLAYVGVLELGGSRQQSCEGRRNVLRGGQRVDLVVPRDVEERVEAA